VRHLLCLLCHLTVLLAALRWAHSASGFLLTGPGLALLLDRYLLRRLPWPDPVSWVKELGLLGAYFVLGAAGFYWLRPGVVPVWEAAYRGFVVSLAGFLGEQAVSLAARAAPGWRARLCLRLAFLATLVVVAPVVATLHPLHIVPKRTPAAMGLAFEDVLIRTADGVRLAAWFVPHGRARGNVVFCHGHGRNRGHVAGFLPTLHDLGLNVLAFDFRGHGDSEGHTSTFGHREVEDLVAAAGYLGRRCPDRPLFVVGVSLGAAVTLQALPRLPGVCGVWSEGSFARLDNVVANWFRWAPAPLRRLLVPLYGTLGRLDCGFWVSGVNPVDCLDRVRVPICFCHGRDDQLVPFADANALYDQYPGPRSCYWVEGGTHYNLRQRHRVEYLRRLRAFLADRLR
jgi:alpha-beta hydrolase superfamily lysophospholipase